MLYRKMLVPLDGSEFAECAIGHARDIAGGCKVPEIDLVTIVKTFFWWEGEVTDPQIIEEIEEDQKSKAAEYLDKKKQELEKAGVIVNTVLMEGNPAEQILDYCSKNGVDVIVMTTHGRSGISRWALGSVAEQVVQHSNVPVLIVSPPGCRIG